MPLPLPGYLDGGQAFSLRSSHFRPAGSQMVVHECLGDVSSSLWGEASTRKQQLAVFEQLNVNTCASTLVVPKLADQHPVSVPQLPQLEPESGLPLGDAVVRGVEGLIVWHRPILGRIADTLSHTLRAALAAHRLGSGRQVMDLSEGVRTHVESTRPSSQQHTEQQSKEPRRRTLCRRSRVCGGVAPVPRVLMQCD